jgi:hypothetical protein
MGGYFFHMEKNHASLTCSYYQENYISPANCWNRVGFFIFHPGQYGAIKLHDADVPNAQFLMPFIRN